MESETSISIELRLHPQEPCKPLDYITRQLESTPVIYKSHESMFVYQGEEYRMVNYSYFFAENLAPGCLGQIWPKCERLGYHSDDLESIAVLFDVSNGAPQHVFYFAHAGRQGTWVPWENCEFTNDGALIVYIALHSHASYPRPGRFLRIFGIINDVCSDKGSRIRPIICACPAGTETIFVRVPPQESITPWQRFALAFYKDLH